MDLLKSIKGHKTIDPTPERGTRRNTTTTRTVPTTTRPPVTPYNKDTTVFIDDHRLY